MPRATNAADSDQGDRIFGRARSCAEITERRRSSADKSIRVVDNGALAASGKAEIQNPELPERVYPPGRTISPVFCRGSREVGATAKTAEHTGAACVVSKLTHREAVQKAAQIRHDHVTTDLPADAKTRRATVCRARPQS